MQQQSNTTASAPRPAGVCIVREGAVASVSVDALQRLGFRTNVSSSCKPDLIVTHQGTTSALMLLPASATAGDLEAAQFSDRFVVGGDMRDGRTHAARMQLACSHMQPHATTFNSHATSTAARAGSHR